jgi:hypothetical protein
MTAMVVRALKETGRPMKLSELVAAVEGQGYRHSQKPKNPAQLAASISALPHKSWLIKRVGHGVYALSADGETREAS